MKKYEENMKKYVENMKKYIMKIRTLPIYGLWDLEKFRVHPLIYGPGGGVENSRVRGTLEKRHETYQFLTSVFQQSYLYLRPSPVCSSSSQLPY